MLLPLLLASTAVAGPPLQDWVRLPRPLLTQPSAVRDSPREVRSSVHLPGLTEMDPDDRERPATELPLATVLELVDGAVRAAVGRVDLRIESLGDELLLAGDAGAIAVAREVLAELDALERALRLELDVVRIDGEGEQRIGRWSGRSGDRMGLGTREERPYLGRYDVNVAADSTAVEPEMWTAWTGTVVHLTAARWSGDAVLVEGHLDVATLRGIETFDPDDVDLGRIELPELDVLEVVFAGFVRPGTPLRLTFDGLPEGLLDGSLEVRLGPLAELPRGVHWHALDLAALAGPAVLPGPAPRDRSEGEVAGLGSGPVAGLRPASLALLLDGGGLDGGPIWTETLLFVPPTASEGADALLAALRAGTSAVRARATEGGRSVAFPALSNRPLRLVLGREHNRLERYRAQVAPEAWVLEPLVDRRHVGLVLEGTVRAGRFDGWATARRTVDGAPLSSAFTGSSAISRAGRRGTATRLTLEVGAGPSARELDGLALGLEFE